MAIAAQQTNVPLSLVAVVSFCFFLTFFILNPGMMSFDSVQTWGMSQTLSFTDQHPPAYPLLVRVLRHLWNDPGVVVLFNVGVFSIGSLLLSEVIRRRWPRFGHLFPLVIFLPFVINFIGVQWKDTALAVCWWTASAIAIYVHDTKPRARHVLMALAYAFFAFGLLVRYNAITAAPFLLFALIAVHLDPLLAQRRRRAAAALFVFSVVTTTSVFVGGVALINQFFEVQKTYVFEAIPIYDLGGITHFTGENVFPYDFSSDEVERIGECYEINDWASYQYRCHFVSDAVRTMGQPLYAAWLEAIVTHPIAYLQHRSTVYMHFLRLGYGHPYHIIFPDIDPNDFGFTHPKHRLFQIFEGYIDSLRNWPFFKPWSWLLLSALTASGALTLARGTMMGVLGASVSLSAVVYLATYSVFGIASDFRYAYWAVLAAMQGSVLLALAWRQRAMDRKTATLPADVPG